MIFYKVKEVPIDSIQVWVEAEARSLETEGIRELAQSIKQEGLQNPPLVQTAKSEGMTVYKLISGQRRLAALKSLGAKTVPVLVMQDAYELGDAKAASVIENLHRKPMNTKDMAEACKFLTEKMGSKTKAAKSLGISLQTFRRYQGFSGVPEAIKDLVPKVITREEATRLYQIVPNINRAVDIANKISKYSRPARRRYLDALAEDPSAPREIIQRRAQSLKARERIFIGLSRTQAKGLAKASTEIGLESEQLAKKVLTDWLARRGYKK